MCVLARKSGFNREVLLGAVEGMQKFIQQVVKVLLTQINTILKIMKHKV